MSCKDMPKKWKEQERKGHKLTPCSKHWLKVEKKESHKAKIGSKAWIKEEMKEKEHRY